jgi:CRISPR-associated protein Csm2
MATTYQGSRRNKDGPPPADDAFVAGLGHRINLRSPSKSLFDTDAEWIANRLRANEKSNKTTQIRRFYDELLRFRASAANTTPEQFEKILPFIRMVNAKAAYASHRKAEQGYLVDGNFIAFLRTMLDQVEDFETLKNACTLFEAVIGFSPRN